MCIRNKVRGNGTSEICLKHGPALLAATCTRTKSVCPCLVGANDKNLLAFFGANANKSVIFSFANLCKLNLRIENSPNKES